MAWRYSEVQKIPNHDFKEDTEEVCFIFSASTPPMHATPKYIYTHTYTCVSECPTPTKPCLHNTLFLHPPASFLVPELSRRVSAASLGLGMSLSLCSSCFAIVELWPIDLAGLLRGPFRISSAGSEGQILGQCQKIVYATCSMNLTWWSG